MRKSWDEGGSWPRTSGLGTDPVLDAGEEEATIEAEESARAAVRLVSIGLVSIGTVLW